MYKFFAKLSYDAKSRIFRNVGEKIIFFIERGLQYSQRTAKGSQPRTHIIMQYFDRYAIKLRLKSVILNFLYLFRHPVGLPLKYSAISKKNEELQSCKKLKTKKSRTTFAYFCLLRDNPKRLSVA